MFHVFEASIADDLWRKIADSFLRGHSHFRQNSRTGVVSEIVHVAITVSEPRQRWITSRRPPLNVAFALAEVIWILRGRDDAAFLNYFNNQLPKYAGTGDRYHGAYGYRLRKCFGLDQLERAYLVLKQNPDSRQVVLQIWDVVRDFPDSTGREVASDIPCNISSFVKVREGRLEWMQVMRSNDVFRGLPYNLIQFTTIQEVLAGWLGLGPGGYHHVSDSLHVYDRDAACIRTSRPVDALHNSDDLALGKSTSDVVFEILETFVDRAVDSENTADELFEFLKGQRLPEGYQNMEFILCAEAARRRRSRIVERCLAECSNASLVQLYRAWLSRMERIAS